MRLCIRRASDILLGGGVIAYPTEGVFGIGCMPDDTAAVLRILAIKNRSPDKGLILIAAAAAEFEDWIAPGDLAALPEPDPERAVTWIAAPGPRATTLIRGRHAGLAVRVTTHPVARELCVAAESPIVSTSANLSGRPTVRNRILLCRSFRHLVDYIVPGDCGRARAPSDIRRLADGQVLRSTES